MATQQELLNQAVEVRDADQNGENTALRVGQVLVDVIESLSRFVERDDLSSNYFTKQEINSLIAGLAKVSQLVALQASLQSEASTRAAADAAMSGKIAELETVLNNLNENITPETLEALAEAIAFLDGIGDDATLATQLAGLNSRLGDVETGLAGKAGVNASTGRLTYSQMPHLVLASMGSDLDGEQTILGDLLDCYVYIQGSRKIFYNNANGDQVAGVTPDKGFVYCNAITRKQYIWTDDQDKPWREIDPEPRTIVSEVSTIYRPTPPDGLDDYWYIFRDSLVTKLIHLYKIGTRIVEERLDLDSRVLYYSVSNEAWYRLDGSNLVRVNVYVKPATGIPASDLAEDVIPNVSNFATKTELRSKANDNEVVKSITANGQTQTPTDGNVNLGTIAKGNDGKNAFELAQQNGYEGTLEQWLQSMAENAGFSYTEDSTTIYVSDALHYDSTPRISINETNIRLSPVVGGTATKTIVVKGYNLSTPITVALIDSSGFYSIDKQTLPVGGGNILLTYRPNEGGTHNATVVISSGQDAEMTVSIVGEAATPTISVDKNTIELKSASGQLATATFRVTGVSLSDMVNIFVNGNGYSVSPAALTANQAMGGADVTVTYDGSSGDGTAVITLSSAGVSNDVVVNASHTVVQRLSVGSTITSYKGFVFTVLEPIVDSNNNTIYPVSVKGSGTSGDVTIPSTVIDENGFEYTVRTIEYEAFKGLPNLTGITIPSSVKVWLGGTGGFTYYSQAFNNCTGLTKVKFEIGSRGFDKSSAFSGCTSLKDIDFGDLSFIPGNNTFMNCRSLVDLLIPNTVTSIGNSLAAPNLKRVQLGTDENCQLTTINNAFGGISTLQCIICYATTPPSFAVYESLTYQGGLAAGVRNFDSSSRDTGTAIDTNGTGRLYVPSTVVNTYKSAGGWSRLVGNANYSGDSDGRIYAIEDIGTIAGHESDALITTNQNNS